jgi:hypothetical protein
MKAEESITGAERPESDELQEVVMNVTEIRDEGQTLKYPKGKLLGIVDTRADCDRLVPALRDAGFTQIEALVGDEGVALLERVGTFFFSDMEERVINRHIQELKSGHVVVAIDAAADRVAEAVQVASRNGARRLVHFGPLTVTWHTK